MLLKNNQVLWRPLLLTNI